MERKYTPGPWEVHGKAIQAIGSTDTADCAVWGSIAFVEDLNDTDYEGRQWCARGNIESNCRLIAAAPDMLDMLIDLQECAQYWSEYDVPLGIVDRLNNVIEKATKTNTED